MKKTILGLAVLSVAVIGCSQKNYTGEGAGIGGVLGAATGAIIGHQSGRTTEGALIGGAVGAGAGAAVGANVDKDGPGEGVSPSK